MTETLVKVQNVSKKFCRDLKSSLWYGIKDLGNEMLGRPHGGDTQLRRDEFWAVNNVSFDLKRGECLGLIGRNGAGKTTLLRILNGLIKPDKGKIEMRGRVGALIALGAGFNPILTGKENIYVNASVLGLSKKEIDAKIEEIVDFADLGEFIDTPVQSYSSGMQVRLGFSIATALDPDVLLLDEVLAVGDFQFRQKCADRINALRRTAAVIFVSHNLREVVLICSKTIVLKQGKNIFQGNSSEAVDCYVSKTNDKANISISENDSIDNHLQTFHDTAIFGPKVHNKEKIENVFLQWVQHSEQPPNTFRHGSPAELRFTFKLLKPTSNIILGLPIWDSNGIRVTSLGTDIQGERVKLTSEGLVQGTVTIEYLCLNPGIYTAFFSVLDGNEFLFRGPLKPIKVEPMPVYFGIVTPKHCWHFETQNF